MKRLLTLAVMGAALLLPGQALAAFAASGLTKIADSGGASQQTFFYTTSDATQTVYADDYFLDVYQAIPDNSIIFVEAADGTLMLRVTASTSSTVTVGEVQGGGKAVTVGTGFDGAQTAVGGVFREGGLIVTRIMIDMTDLLATNNTDTDIIGDDTGVASAYITQVTEAINGTIVGLRMTCLELPVGAADDIDLYSAVESDGEEDEIVTDLDETALVTSGAAWANGTVKGATALPTANEYLYLTLGEADNGTYTAGKFVIELFGTP